MSELFLAPATGRQDAYSYLRESVVNGVPEQFLTEHFTDGAPSKHIWGLTESLTGSWETVKSGDWILFYTRSNQYEYAARVVTTGEQPELGQEIRDKVLNPSSVDRDWTLLIFLEEPISVSVTGDHLSDLLNYGNKYPVRFIRVIEERAKRINSEYGSVDEFIAEIAE
jgi:hypothetical protein